LSLAQTFHERREQFHGLRLGEYLDPFNAAANSFIAHAQAFFSQQIADPVAARQLGLQELENLRQQQASSLAYFDCFWIFAVLTFVLVFVALCLKRSVAEKGARLTGE
jgi:MFS transporter, DHA2 family, multidrug resistance protein